VGLISDKAWNDFQAKQERLAAIKKLLEQTRLTTSMLSQAWPDESPAPHSEEATGGEPGSSAMVGLVLAQILKRPEIVIEKLAPILRELDPGFFAREEEAEVRENPRESVAAISSEIRNELKSVETEIKYEGYLLQQQRAMERMKKSEQRSIPGWFDYHSVSGLSREMQEKLTHVQPRTLAQASRIPGVTPAAVSLVNVFIEIQARRREQAAAI